MIDPVLQRKMFSPKQEEMIDQGTEAVASIAEGQGITSGLVEMADEAQRIMDSVDEASDYEQLMNALREEPASMEDRVDELAEVVGEADAKKTPESVLAFMQPFLGLLETFEKGSQMQQDPTMGVGITAGLVDEPVQAPGQEEAMARMAMGEQPVMLKNGGDPEDAEQGESALPKGFNKEALPASFNLQNYQTLMDLVPQATGYDEYLKQYQDLLGSDATGYETAPYLSGLQLAAAIANAPKGELLSRVLDPTTISAVSDPILQAAQAKAKQDQAIKLKAAEAASASKTAAQESKSDLLKTFATEAAKVPDLNIQKLDDGSVIGVNVRTGAVTPLQEGSINWQSQKLDNNQVMLYNPRATAEEIGVEGKGYKLIGTAKGNFDLKITNTGDILKFNKDTGVITLEAPEGVVRPYKVFQTPQGQFFKYDGKDAVQITADGVEMGPMPTDLIRNIKELESAQKALATLDPDTDSAAFESAAQKIEILQKQLMPKDTEFERLLEDGANLAYTAAIETGKSPTEAEAAKTKFRANGINNYLNAKTTLTTNYDPRKSINDVFAKMLGDDITKLNENVALSADLENYAKQAATASENFETGALAGTRLNLQKFIKAIPGLDTFLKEGVSGDVYNTIMGGDPVSGEAAQFASNQFALRMSQFIPGNLNKEELDMVQGAGPSLYTTPEGLKLLSKIYTKAANRARNEQAFVTNWMQKDGAEIADAEGKYLALSKARAEWRAKPENKVVDADEIANLPSASLAGDIKAQRVNPEGGTDTFNLTDRQSTMAKFISGFDSFDKFKANAGQLVSLGVLRDRKGKVITNVPSEDSLKKLWGTYSGMTFVGGQ